MFYLKEFFKSIGESPIRGTFFLLFSFLLSIGLTHRPFIASIVEKITPEKMVNPYFVAVIDGSVDSSRIKFALSKLPGVVSIDDKETEKSRYKLKSLISQLGTDYALNSDLMNFKSLRIMMNPSLSIESLDFVKEQVIKMGGKSHVSTTDIKYPEVTSVMKGHPFYSFISKAGDWGILAVLAILWIVSYWLCYDIFRSRSYVIEKFQRKTFVASKSLASGLGLIVVVSTALGIWNGTLKFFDLVILLMIFSVFWTFSMQNWRWKPTL